MQMPKRQTLPALGWIARIRGACTFGKDLMADNVARRTRTWLKNLRNAAALAAALAVSALAWPVGDAQAAATSGLRSLSGNYLAGRYASKQRDNRAAAEFYSRALQADPNNHEILERAFLLELSASNIVKAEYLARRMIGIDPRNRLARIVAGLREFKSGDYRQARVHWTHASHGAIGQLTGALLIAWAHVAEENYQEALAALEVLSGNETFEIYRAYHAALVSDLSGDEDLARANYERAYEVSGTALRTVETYGNFLARHGELDEARAVYDAYQTRSQRHPSIQSAVDAIDANTAIEPLVPDARIGAAEALYGIASALADETGLDFSIMYAQLTLSLRSDFPIARTLLASVYENVRRYEEAIDVYGGIGQTSPLWPNAQVQTAVDLNLLDRFDEARERLEQLIEHDGTAYQPNLTLANILRNHSQFDEAAKHYTRALELIDDVDQRHWTVFYFRGISFERTRNWQKAEADFLYALELQPDQPLVLNYLGYSWIEKRHNLVEAMRMIRKAVELRPTDGYIVDSLGWAHYQLKEFEDAVRELERAVELRPDDPIINDHLGDAYWRVGRELEARFQWRHSLDLEPDPEDIDEIERKLENGLVDDAAALAESQSNRS